MLLGGSRYDQIPFTVGNQLQVGFPLRGVVGFRLNGLGFGSSFGDLLHAAFGIIEEAAVTQWAGDDGNDRRASITLRGRFTGPTAAFADCLFVIAHTGRYVLR